METTPIHEAVEALPGPFQAGITIAVLVALLVAIVAIVLHAINATRERNRR